MAIAQRTRRADRESRLVTRQAQYIFITLRQAILNFPTRYARHVLGIADEHQAKAVLTKAAHEFLTELASFSEKAIDPGWMQIEADGSEEKAPSPIKRSGDQGRAGEGGTSPEAENADHAKSACQEKVRGEDRLTPLASRDAGKNARCFFSAQAKSYLIRWTPVTTQLLDLLS